MGISVRTVETVTCDLCHEECKKEDGSIEIQVSSGFRDVGPSMVIGKLQVEIPYGCTKGIICSPCKMKWLSLYVKNQGMA